MMIQAYNRCQLDLEGGFIKQPPINWLILGVVEKFRHIGSVLC